MKSEFMQTLAAGFRGGVIGFKVAFSQWRRELMRNLKRLPYLIVPGWEEIDPEITRQINAEYGVVESETNTQKRTRSDAIKTSMNAYLGECTASGKKPDIDECWRFTAERQGIEENHNGNLSYPIHAGKRVKEINRKQFSDRLNKLLRER